MSTKSLLILHGKQATNEEVEFQVVIFFPWNPEERLFSGERVWFSFEKW